MKPGRGSETAVWVCSARAFAHGQSPIPRFSDPIALELLPAEARARVERFRSGNLDGARDKMQFEFMKRRGMAMAVRTVAIDDALRGAPHAQVVILGAGLDGRAWRMEELKNATVFEVDHPDSQRDKTSRIGALTPVAKTVRFVPVDFTKDSLDASLTAAGHVPKQPTTWVWEGVVMYLTKDAMKASLQVVSERSAPGSRLILNYHQGSFMGLVVGLLVRRLGEPFRAVYKPEEMRAILQAHHFDVIQDESVPEITARIAPQVANELRMMRHMRIVAGTRR